MEFKYIYLFSILDHDNGSKATCKTIYANNLDEALDKLTEKLPSSVITNVYREEMEK